ncbi:MAG: hypothetical protein WKF74_16810 [Pyrinomonadaceae bacterium]
MIPIPLRAAHAAYQKSKSAASGQLNGTQNLSSMQAKKGAEDELYHRNQP